MNRFIGFVICGLLLAGVQTASAQVVRIVPIVVQTPTPDAAAQSPGVTPPTSATRVDAVATFYVEIWATNANFPLGGLACVHADLSYNRTDLIDSVPPIQNGPLFTVNGVVAAFNDALGLVDDVGGCQPIPPVAALGVGEWALVERIEMNAVGIGGPITVQVSDAANLFVGTSIIGQAVNVDSADIDFLSNVFFVGDCTVDGDCNDGQFCNGVETCVANSCVAGTAVNCDDGIGCTDDSCDEVGDACVNAPNDGLCDNGQFCDGVEICDPALDCQAGTAPNCDDAVGCTADTCDEVADICVNTPLDINCDNGVFCDGLETCDPTLDCQPGGGFPCDDAIGCTDDSCDEVADVCINAPNDASCDNGQFCDGPETCDPILDCQVGLALACDDSVSCTIDTCDEVTDACVNTADSTLCDNGDFCDGVEVCDPVNDCVAGTAVNCTDGVGCTVDTCDEVADACVNTPDNSLCNNSQFCDGVEVCNALLDCQAGPVTDCDDAIACTVDSCDEINDVCINATNDATCDNGVFCDGVETCSPGVGCVSGADPCDDTDLCTSDSCDEASDSCVHTPIPGCLGCVSNIDCNDSIACTVDQCVDGVCTNTASNALCGNGLFCDGLETCNPLVGCISGSTVNCNDNVPCTLDLCDEGDDACTHTPFDSACNDGLFCNGEEVCNALLGCQGNPILCDDGIACTADACNEATDSCVSVPDPASCDNGDFCDGVDTCDPVLGCVSPDDPCDDSVFCTVDSCNDTVDACSHVPVDALCDDGNELNGVETCHPILDCQPGNAMTLMRVRPVVRQVPSGLTTTVGAPPVGDLVIETASMFVVEMWAQMTVEMPELPLSGVCCSFSDLQYDFTAMTCDSITPSADFNSFDSGTCFFGLTDELGGCTVQPSLGITPNWVLISTVGMSSGVTSLGNTIRALPSALPSAICQFGSVGPTQIQFDESDPFDIRTTCLYDLDGDECVGPGDFAFVVPCWLRCDTDPLWGSLNCDSADFDCSGCVDPGDFAFFVTGWLRCCGDPQILFPAPCGAPQPAVPPSNRKLIESFGLPYPDGSDPRIKTLENWKTAPRAPRERHEVSRVRSEKTRIKGSKD